MQDAITQTPRFVRAKEGAARFGVSVATWWSCNILLSRHYRPDFPKPIKVSANATGWLESEVSSYIQKLADSREQ